MQRSARFLYPDFFAQALSRSPPPKRTRAMAVANLHVAVSLRMPCSAILRISSAGSLETERRGGRRAQPS